MYRNEYNYSGFCDKRIDRFTEKVKTKAWFRLFHLTFKIQI